MMTDFDKMFEYFRNTNTMPGPNAGHSIDPSKPGPDDDLAGPDPLYKDIERILDDESAWIARPNKNVTMRIAIAAFMKAQSVLAQSNTTEKELNDIAVAIGSNRFLDPPDGGSVSLAEQVTRMRQALEKAEAALAQSRGENDWLRTALRAAQIALAQSNVAEPVRAFAKAILHGDDDHKAWLLEAAEAFIARKPLPPLRGKGVQSDAEPVAWRPDADMRAELDRSELVARALLKEIMKQIDYIESEGHIEWHKRITVHGELYLPDLSAAALAVLYTAPPRPDASAGLIEAAEFTDQLFSLAFDITPIESCEIMELGEKLGLLEQVAYDPKIHDGEIDADEGDLIYVRSAKGEALRARDADRSGK